MGTKEKLGCGLALGVVIIRIGFIAGLIVMAVLILRWMGVL